MDGERTQDESENKGWLKALAFLEIGVFELVFVLVVLALFFGTLNYFNILSLSSLYPNQLGFLPHRPLQQSQQNIPRPSPSPTPEFLSNPLVARAKNIGYNIIWMDPSDTVGRTVFYDWKGTYGSGGIGPKEIKNQNGTIYIRHITGLFQGFQEIPNSSDKHLLLKNPLTQEILSPLRITLTQSESTSSATPHFPLTSLFVEDLSILTNNATGSASSLGEFRNWKTTDLQIVLEKGDAVVASLWSNMTRTQQGVVMGKTPKDNEGNFGVLHLHLRRFGGKTEVEKELGHSI